MSTFLITGCSRGLGLAMVARLASLPKHEVGTVFATSRQNNSSRMRELIDSTSNRIDLVPLDVTSQDSITDATRRVERQLQGRGLDVLINNAGIMPLSRDGLEGMYVILSVTSAVADRFQGTI